MRADLYLGSTLVGTTLLPTTGASDSGPDSADGDNYRFRVPAVGKVAFFNKIVLQGRPVDPRRGLQPGRR